MHLSSDISGVRLDSPFDKKFFIPLPWWQVKKQTP